MNRPEDFQRLLTWLKRRWGISVHETQWVGLALFLEDQWENPFRTLQEYQARVEADEDLKNSLIDAATIGETYFFRDESQFTLLRDWLFPLFRSQFLRMPTVWSAACSTGEEALSLLLLMAHCWGVDPVSCRGRVLASDVNLRALRQFTTGIFRNSSLRVDGTAFHPLLEPFLERTGHDLRVEKNLLDLVGWRQINLITDSLDSFQGRMDVILLRNMMIYVSLDERPLIYKKISEKLTDEGVLILGKAELPFFQEQSMALAEIGSTFVLIKKGSRLWSGVKSGEAWSIRN